MSLSTRPLAEALGQLETHMGLVDSSLGKADPKLALALVTAAIKSFEYSCELAVKLIRRRLEQVASAPKEVGQLDFRAVMQRTVEQDLVSGWQEWMTFRHKRNITSHTYHPAVAREVLSALSGFLREARRLLDRLDKVPADAISSRSKWPKSGKSCRSTRATRRFTASAPACVGGCSSAPPISTFASGGAAC